VSEPGAAAALPGQQGAIVWAVTLFENERPFVVRHERTGKLATYADAEALARAVRARGIPPEFAFVAGAKIRPVLLLQDRPARRLPEYAALKLTRLAKFAPGDRDVIRSQDEPGFFHLADPQRYGLRDEFAVDLNALVRVNRTAIVGRPVGRLDLNEFRVVCERLVRFLDLNLANLVVREAAAFLQRHGLAPPAE
jgi:hypothetical protein